MAYYLIIIAVIIFDRIVKHIVSSQMIVGETIPVIEDMFHITYVQNSGAAFSIMEGQWIFIILIPAVLMAAILVVLFIMRKKWDPLMRSSLAFICGGGIGNLLDRISQGYVVDMFDFRVFPVFNIADIFICAGCGLLILSVWLSERKSVKNDVQ